MTELADGRSRTVRNFFSRRTRVAIDISASAEEIWALLTDAERFPIWNSTVIKLTGTIAPGRRIELRSTLDPERTFRLRVKKFEPYERLSWGNVMGTRRYSLESIGSGRTRFTMVEDIGGPLFPLFSRMIPSFDESFERFAADLKAAAE